MIRIIVSILLILSINCKSQNLKSTVTDSILVNFIGAFEYDFVDLYVNGVFIKEFFLYSDDNNVTHEEIKIVHENLDSITFTAVFYLNNHNVNLKYSPLWGNLDKNFSLDFNPPKSYKFVWRKENGNFAYIQTELCGEFVYQKFAKRADCYNLTFSQTKKMKVGFD